MTTADHHLRSIALNWTDLQDALATTGTIKWPPAGRMSDYLTALDQADAELAEAARWQAAYNRQFLDRDPNQAGATRPPLRITILDIMRTVETALTATADQVAAAVQRSPMNPALRSWPAADRQRRDQPARADATDPRRWRYGGRHTAPHAALWLLARVQGRPGPFRPLPDREAQLIANVAQEGARRVEQALDIAGRTATLAKPCPDCQGRLELHGGAGASPVAHCTQCGRTWTEGGGRGGSLTGQPRGGPMAIKKIEHVAPKKQFMTLDDLEAFVQDAKRSGATGGEILSATVSFGGKLQKISAEVDIIRAGRPSLDKEPGIG